MLSQLFSHTIQPLRHHPIPARLWLGTPCKSRLGTKLSIDGSLKLVDKHDFLKRSFLQTTRTFTTKNGSVCQFSSGHKFWPTLLSPKVNFLGPSWSLWSLVSFEGPGEVGQVSGLDVRDRSHPGGRDEWSSSRKLGSCCCCNELQLMGCWCNFTDLTDSFCIIYIFIFFLIGWFNHKWLDVWFDEIETNHKVWELGRFLGDESPAWYEENAHSSTKNLGFAFTSLLLCFGQSISCSDGCKWKTLRLFDSPGWGGAHLKKDM